MSRPSFLKSLSTTYFFRVIYIASEVLAGVVTARWLGPEKCGVLTLALLFPATAWQFFNFGIGSAVNYFVSRRRMRTGQAIAIAQWGGLGLGILAVAALLSAHALGLNTWRGLGWPLLALMIALVPLRMSYNFLSRVVWARWDFYGANLSFLADSVLKVAALLLLLAWFRLDLVGAALAFLLAELGALAVVFWRLGKLGEDGTSERGTAPQPVRPTELFKQGMGNYLLMLSGFLRSNIEPFLFKHFGLVYALGLYGRAASLVTRSRTLYQPVSQVLFPYVASDSEEVAVRRTNSLCRTHVFAMTLLAAGLICFARPLIHTLYGEAFLPAVPAFQCLALTLPMMPYTEFIMMHLAGSGKPGTAAVRNLLVLPLLFGGCWWVLRSGGPLWQIALVVVASNWVSMLVLHLIYCRTFKVSFAESLVVRKEDFHSVRERIKRLGGGPRDARNVLYVLGWPLGQGGHVASTLAHVKYLARMGTKITLFAPDGPNRKEFERHVAEFRTMPTNTDRLALLRGSLRVLRYCLRKPCGVIHAMDPVALKYCLPARLLLRISLVYTEAGGPAHWTPPPVDHLIAFSEEVCEKLGPRLPAVPITLIRERVDTEIYTPAQDSVDTKERGQNRELRVAMCMRLESQKRPWIDTMLSAMEALGNSHTAVSLILAGGGSLLPEYQEKAQALNRSSGREVVKMLGPVHGAEAMVNIYRSADLVAGHGRGILEAMSCGKLAIILGENGRASLITPENVRLIAHYNFSGRHFTVPGAEGETVVSILKKVADAVLVPRLQELRQFGQQYVRSYYDAKVGAAKIAGVFAAAFAECRTAPVRSGILQWILRRSLARGLAPFRRWKHN